MIGRIGTSLTAVSFLHFRSKRPGADRPGFPENAYSHAPKPGAWTRTPYASHCVVPSGRAARISRRSPTAKRTVRRLGNRAGARQAIVGGRLTSDCRGARMVPGDIVKLRAPRCVFTSLDPSTVEVEAFDKVEALLGELPLLGVP